MSSNRSSRSREVITLSTGNKRLKTDSHRRKAVDADTANAANQTPATRRKKSRSPSSGRRTDPFITMPTTKPPKKKRSLPQIAGVARESGTDNIDRSHKVRPSTPTLSPPTTHARSGNVHHTRTKKENTRDHHLTPAKDKDIEMETSVYSSALAMAENERQKEKLKMEVDALKQQLHDNKKVMKKQHKIIQELKAENNTGQIARKDQEVQLESLKTKTRQYDDALSSIENSLQCQICMELLLRPFALSPCGHVLCLPCLQEWFRKAPPSADDMDIDPEDYDDPHYIMHRQKSCPCCRATILHRPVPVFLVKSVATALMKAKGPGHTAGSPVARADGTSTVTADDVWAGLFPTDEDMLDPEEGYEDEYEYDNLPGPFHAPFMPWMGNLLEQFEESDEDETYTSFEEGHSMDEDESSDEQDDDDFAGVYVMPVWERPSVHFRGGNRHSAQFTKMMRRGCTREMIQTYGMTYSHTGGLVLYLRSLDPDAPITGPFPEAERAGMYRFAIGWNVSLAPDDRGGHAYVNDLLHQYADNPAGFLISLGAPAGMDIRKLVRIVDIQELSDGTSDSEAWHDVL